MRLVVKTARECDLGERAPLPDATERSLQPDNPREGLWREPDVLAKLTLQLPEARAGPQDERVHRHAAATLENRSDGGVHVAARRRTGNRDQPFLERTNALAVIRRFCQALAQPLRRGKNQLEVHEAARDLLERKAEEGP